MASWTRTRPVVIPGRTVDEPYASLFAGRTSLARFVADAPARVDPVYDDRPFFFARQKPWGLPDSMRNAFLLMVAPLVVGCVVFLVRGRPPGAAPGPYAASIAYFASLGLGFIAVELSLLQHLTLLLGHPIFTLSILLFTLLAAGGVGSYFSARFAPGRACLAVSALGLVYALVLPRLVPVLLAWDLPARIAAAVVLVAPLGFAMGMPFPDGLRRTGGTDLPAPPFYWGLNGVFSVVGSLGTMVLAVTMGFTVAMLVGCGLYLVAAAAAPRLARQPA
jgi:hypothetical protein